MLKQLLITLLVFAFSLGAMAAPEDTYIKTRDQLKKEIASKKVFDEKADRAGIAKIEKLLRETLGKSKIKGFDGDGKIAIETFSNEPGADQIDGLQFTKGDDMLFMSSPTLIKNYQDRNSDIAKTTTGLAKDETFYTKAFDWGSAFSFFREFKTSKPETVVQLALNAQDIGPFSPNMILVFAVKADRIYALRSEIKEQNKIPECSKIWERALAKGEEEIDEGQVMDNYVDCWNKNLAKQKFYPALEKRAKELAALFDSK